MPFCKVSDGDTGWDVFSLTYKATPPINTILNSKASRAFASITNFLWSMKRIDHALGSAWKPRMKLAQNLRDSAGNRKPVKYHYYQRRCDGAFF